VTAWISSGIVLVSGVIRDSPEDMKGRGKRRRNFSSKQRRERKRRDSGFLRDHTFGGGRIRSRI
jgi:hypothetical protein